MTANDLPPHGPLGVYTIPLFFPIWAQLLLFLLGLAVVSSGLAYWWRRRKRRVTARDWLKESLAILQHPEAHDLATLHDAWRQYLTSGWHLEAWSCTAGELTQLMRQQLRLPYALLEPVLEAVELAYREKFSGQPAAVDTLQQNKQAFAAAVAALETLRQEAQSLQQKEGEREKEKKEKEHHHV